MASNLDDFVQQVISAVWDHALSEFKPIAIEMAAESDRGSILVAQSALDKMLRDIFDLIFRHRRPGIKNKDINLLLNGVLAPLGGFFKRVEFAHALGIIDGDFREVMNKINKMRIDCAHSPNIVEFNAERVAALVAHTDDIFEGLATESFDTLTESTKNLRQELNELGGFRYNLDERHRFIAVCKILFFSLCSLRISVEIMGWPKPGHWTSNPDFIANACRILGLDAPVTPQEEVDPPSGPSE